MQPIAEPELTPQLIRARADALMARLRAVAEAAGRDPNGFRLVAVTKGFGISAVRVAVEAGLTTLGENRVQEAGPKVEAHPLVDWHLVGHLQSNKARQAVRLFSTVHSVDSLELLLRLDRVAGEEERSAGVLLQVNVSGEAGREGFDADWFADQVDRPAELVAAIGSGRAVEVRGLMAMAPFGATPDQQRAVFAHLRDLRDRLQQRLGWPLPDLSMGMSADAEAAVAEGSTLVRVGTAIFGPRPDG